MLIFLSVTRRSAQLGNVAALLLAGFAQAHNPTSGFDLARMTGQADLVAFARVVDITYANSDGSGGQPPVPHTFVTFEVLDTLLGRSEPKVTLRFAGGLDARTGDVTFFPVYPGFDVGDTDFILVRGNTASECPLVECAGGRFRTDGDHVYTDTGKPVLLDDRGGLRFGPRQRLPAVTNQRFGRVVLGTAQAPKPRADDAGGEPRAVAPPRGRHLTSREFADVLREAIARSGTASANRLPVANADPRRAFRFQSPALEPKAPGAAPVAPIAGARDDRELEALRKSRGNPVVEATTKPIDRPRKQ